MRLFRVLPLIAAAALPVACGENGVGPADPPTNAPPTAGFAAECGPLDCRFTNSSSDTDGSIEAYAWDFGDGTLRRTTRDAVHTYAAPGGRFMVTLGVTDDDGESATASREVEVNEPNAPPIAEFAYACDNLACRFTDQSRDGNVLGSVVTYAWDFGDGEISREENPVHTYAARGTYTVVLTVTDDLAETGQRSRRVTVNAPNTDSFPPVPPTALAYDRVPTPGVLFSPLERYVIDEDGTFGLQYAKTSWGFLEFTGRYTRAGASIGFYFDASGAWVATGGIQGDSLTVMYNLDMMLSDFADGTYRLAPSP